MGGGERVGGGEEITDALNADAQALFESIFFGYGV